MWEAQQSDCSGPPHGRASWEHGATGTLPPAPLKQFPGKGPVSAGHPERFFRMATNSRSPCRRWEAGAPYPPVALTCPRGSAGGARGDSSSWGGAGAGASGREGRDCAGCICILQQKDRNRKNKDSLKKEKQSFHMNNSDRSWLAYPGGLTWEPQSWEALTDTARHQV